MSGSTPTGTRDIGATAREMWATRPARSEADRKVAGVAGAIARRYAVDPTLVRVAFVVLALSGGGLLLYLAGWVALPADPADPPRRGRGRSGPPVGVLVVAAVVAVATLGPVLGGRVQGLIGVAVAALLLYTLHTGRAHLGAATTTGAATGGTTTTGTTTTGTTTGDDADPSTQPPSWDPLGAAPFAWDLPEPSAPPAPAAPRSRLTPITLALALLVGGALAILRLAAFPGLPMSAVFGGALAVVGLGLLVGAFRPGGRGLVAAAVPLVVLTVVSAAAGGGSGFGDDDGDGASRGLGDVSAAPAAAALVAPTYRTGLGEVDLDLGRVTATPTGPVRTTVQTGAGDARVTVPATADVAATCRSGVGDVDCLGRPGEVATVVDPGPDGPGGPVFDLIVESGAGAVEVRRG